jgi:hypothetical protein
MESIVKWQWTSYVLHVQKVNKAGTDYHIRADVSVMPQKIHETNRFWQIVTLDSLNNNICHDVAGLATVHTTRSCT